MGEDRKEDRRTAKGTLARGMLVSAVRAKATGATHKKLTHDLGMAEHGSTSSSQLNTDHGR